MLVVPLNNDASFSSKGTDSHVMPLPVEIPVGTTITNVAAASSVVSSDRADDGNDELLLEEHIDLSVSDHVICLRITS